jgi:hypothetical protein
LSNATAEPKPMRPAFTAPETREPWEPADEPTRLERIIASQFRRGLPVPLTPVEQQKMLAMNLEQRCDYIAKMVVWTARATEKHIRESDPNKGNK